MDLCVPTVATDLLAEFIHKQIDHPIDHWVRAGRLIGKVLYTTSNAIAAQRQAHHDLLVSKYPGVGSWMPHCI